MSNDSMFANKRKGIRHPPDRGQFAQICFNMNNSTFACDIVALIFNESYRGCCLIAMKDDLLTVRTKCMVKVGKSEPVVGELKWIESIDNEIGKYGFYFGD